MMRGQDLDALEALVRRVVAPAPRRRWDGDLGLLLQPIPCESAASAAFVGRGDRSHASTDRAAEREDQPPEIRSEMKRAHLLRMPPRHRGFDPAAFAQSRTQ